MLVVRVHNLVPESVWYQRYQQINHFERLLADSGTTILKCFLHVGLEEQRQRLQARIDNPDAHWKVNLQDLEERKLWDSYQTAYEDAITNCNKSHAPWQIVPADRKWYRNLVVSQLMLETMRGMNPQYPQVPEDYSGIKVE